MIDIQYTYLLGSLFFLSVWLILFIYKKMLRREILWSSIVILPTGFLEVFFNPEYWNPTTVFESIKPLNIESFIFIFALGGIAAVLYETVFNIKHVKRKKDNKGYYVFLVFILSLFLTDIIFEINIIYDYIIAGFVGAIYLVIRRKDLLKESIFGSLIFAILYIILFLLLLSINPNFVVEEWNLANLTGIFFFGIPIEEILFALALGAIWGPIYDEIKGYKLKN